MANKYNNLVNALIVDRSFYELSSVPEGKIKGSCTARLYDLLSWRWRTLNHSNFVTTGSQCYKIITCDPLDDTVDLFGNLATGVAQQLATVDYANSETYSQFYETLLRLIAEEHWLYTNSLSESERDQLHASLIETFTEIENEYNAANVQIRLIEKDMLEIEEEDGSAHHVSTSLNATEEDHRMLDEVAN